MILTFSKEMDLDGYLHVISLDLTLRDHHHELIIWIKCKRAVVNVTKMDQIVLSGLPLRGGTMCL